MTRDLETNEFMIIMKFANKGNLRSILSNNFNNIFWYDKIRLLCHILTDLYDVHQLGYLHRHS
jgi:hypothetical protein